MIILDPIQHKERKHYFLDHNSEVWIRTSLVARVLGIDHITLNRDCRLAYFENTGNLANKQEYIKSINGHWWVRQDIDDVYTMLAPGRAGQGEDPSWFFVKDLQFGPRP